MRIVIVDDEERARNMLEILLRSIGEQDICSFSEAEPALAYLKLNCCDVAFLDVEMPGMDGLDLADELLKLPVSPAVVFETAYPQYAVRAWDSDAVDYLLKPYGQDQVRRALERATRRNEMQRQGGSSNVEIQCFPTFGLWVNGVPLSFDNRKAKELLAYLVHMQGAWVSTDRIIYALFEDSDEKKREELLSIAALSPEANFERSGFGKSGGKRLWQGSGEFFDVCLRLLPLSAGRKKPVFWGIYVRLWLGGANLG